MAKRNKRGRPLQSPLVRDHIVGIRLNEQELKALTLYCWRYDQITSDVVRDALMILGIIPDCWKVTKTATKSA